MSATARTRIKARLLPRWPATINGDPFISTTRAGSSLTLAWSMSGLSPEAAPAAGFRFLGFDPSAGIYRYVTRDSLVGTVTVQLADITDMSAEARALAALGSYSAMRTTLGAAAAIHSHVAADIVDSTAFGRSMLGAANAAAATALLSTVVGDSGGGGTKGLVPAPAAGDALAAKFLAADGQWHDVLVSHIDGFAEGVDDRVAALIQGGAGISWTYNDGLNTLQANWTGLNVQKAGSLIGTKGIVNFMEGAGISTTVADNGGAGRIDVTIAAPSAVLGPAAATDNAIARFDGTTGKLVQDSVVGINDTTGALFHTGGNGVPIQGTNTNNNAAAGYVGEFIENTLPSGSAVNLTTAAATNITSISLTAGDWDVWGAIVFLAAGTPTRVLGTIHTVSATIPTAPNGGAYTDFRATFAAGAAQSLPVGMRRLSLAAPTTVHLVGYAEFSSTMVGYGHIGARRVR